MAEEVSEMFVNKSLSKYGLVVCKQKDTFLAKSHLLNTGNSKMHLTDSTLYPFSHSEYKKIPQPPSLVPN